MNLEKDLERVKELLKEVKYLTFEQISSFLDWTEQDKKDYKAILMSWVDSGDLILSKKNRFSLPENLGYVKGVFRIIKNRFAFVDREDSVEKEGIFIPKEEFNNALDEDTVLERLSYVFLVSLAFLCKNPNKSMWNSTLGILNAL